MKFIKSIPFLFFQLAVLIHAQNFISIHNEINSYKKSVLLKNAQWSLCAKYVDNGEEILNYNSDMSLAPASGLKVFTSIAALAILGEEFRFETKLFYDGKIEKNGTLNGNIYLVGDGDPTFGSELVESSLSLNNLMDSIVAVLKANDIKKINGAIISDDLKYNTKQIPDHWEWTDIGNYYGAASSALTINENMYRLYFKPGRRIGDNAEVIRIEPEIQNLKFTNFMKTGRAGSGDNGYIYNAPGQFNAVLRGTIPQGYDEFLIKGSIPEPPLFAAQFLHNYLIGENIFIGNNPFKTDDKIDYSNKKILCTFKSPPVKKIVYILNKKSNNLYAELLLKAIAYYKTGIGSTETGTKVLEEFLSDNNIENEGVMLYDGSGLSRSNTITAKSMVDLLVFARDQKYWSTFNNSLASVGDENDISAHRNMGIATAIERNAHIKSGVILGVRSYSGYLSDKSGRSIAFSFIANNFNGNGSDVSEIHKELMIKLAELKGKN